MRPIEVLLLGALAAMPAAAADPEAALAKFLAGRHAGAPVECIRPDRTVPPETFDGTAIVYRDARTTYVNRFAAACPQLRRNRTAIVTGAGGRLCRSDPVRIVEATGAGFGFCTLGSFIPYDKN